MKKAVQLSLRSRVSDMPLFKVSANCNKHVESQFF